MWRRNTRKRPTRAAWKRPCGQRSPSARSGLARRPGPSPAAQRLWYRNQSARTRLVWHAMCRTRGAEAGLGPRRRRDLHARCLAVCSCALPPQVAVLQGQTFHIANIGDCRAVMVRHDGHERLTEDHKVSSPAERQRIIAAGGTIVDDRIVLKTYVPRACHCARPGGQRRTVHWSAVGTNAPPPACALFRCGWGRGGRGVPCGLGSQWQQHQPVPQPW